MSEQIETQSVELPVADGTSLPAYVARPTGGGSPSGLIVLQEAFGVNAHIRDVTERFARAGYTSIAPALFHRTAPDFEGDYKDFASVLPHMQALTDTGQAADIEAAYGWLTGSAGAKAVGAIGYCMGGRTAFLANATLPIQASVSYYGGGIAPNPQRPGSDLLGRVSDLHAPLLLFWGGKDNHIGLGQVRAVEDALRAADANYAQVVFSQADHAFFCDARASYEPKAARQSWALTLEFLRTYVAPAASS